MNREKVLIAPQHTVPAFRIHSDGLNGTESTLKQGKQMKKTSIGISIIAALLLGASAQADVLINIDLSVANQITLTATAGNSEATISTFRHIPKTM